MNLIRRIGMACAILACASLGLAEDKPRYTTAAERAKDASQLSNRVQSPSKEAPTAEFGIAKTRKTPKTGRTFSPDGAAFLVEAGRLTASKPDAGSGSRGEGCGDPESGSCCEGNGTPFCEDAECCEFVCYALGMTWCCEEGEEGGWWGDCADAAREWCECPAQTAACCYGDQCVEMEEIPCILDGGEWFHSTHCETFTCPGCSAEDSLFSQSVVDWGSYYGTTSDLDSEYSIAYERFWGVAGDICGVKWVGTGNALDGWECFEDPMTFEIKFYEDDGGVPGAEVCSYTATVYATIVSEMYLWLEYEVQFDTCCTLENGFISIAGTGGDPECQFGWIEGVLGDGTHCSWVEDEEEGYWHCPPAGEDWSFDVNFCLLGTPYPGACCDEVEGTCEVVEAVDCPPTSRFSPGVTCEEMDPPCGALAGACCIDEPPYCYIASETNCEGVYLGHGTFCDPTDCNENGVPDSCDIAGGYSADCDANGVPDECDIDAGADDYDANGVLDACEPDCNANGVVDACDIDCTTGDCGDHPLSCGVSSDCQPNGIPDECELGTLGDPTLWDNGAPNDTQVLRSHFGGQFEDALTVDDFNLPEGGIVNGLHWTVEENDEFDWQGFVHVFIFGDNGAGGPDDGNELMYFTVPDDGVTIFKSRIGDGVSMANRVRYDVYGLDIPLGPGTYWLGLAPDGGAFGYEYTGASKWCSSQTGGAVLGGQSHIRVPSYGMDLFVPWSQQGAPGPHDASFSVMTTFYGADCDGNGIPDDCDIANCDGSDWCQDCQGNGILDGCEPDCNSNGVADQCDIMNCDGSTWCGDCDSNGIPDECQIPPLGEEPDCNGNGTPDACDLASGFSQDCNGNGIPDECDIADGFSDDYDLNGVPDDCDPDCNGNGVVDACDTNCSTGDCGSHPLGCGASQDCQPDGVPDECQLFSGLDYVTDDGVADNGTGLTNGGSIAWLNHFVVQDGVTTVSAIKIAWGNVAAGTPCMVYLWSDPNNDGSPDDAIVLASAATAVANPDTNTYITVDIADAYVGPNGAGFFVGAILTHAPGEHPAALDYDGWGTGWIAGSTSGVVNPDDLAASEVALQPYVDAWLIRAVGLESNDCNNNDVPDECDIAAGTSEDCDGNGMPDECEWIDCNDNGVLDACDLLTCDGSAWCSDCNSNDVIDVCDILSGFSADCQSDGVPDECQIGASVLLLEETFYTTSFWDEPLPNGWESVTVAGAPWNEWIMTGAWGCDYEGGAAVWGTIEEGEGLDRGYLDIYMLSPEMTETQGVVSFCTTGCGSGSRPWCENMTLDLMIVIGDIGGGDDVFVGCISDLWTGYFNQFIEPEFDLDGLLPGGAFRVGFRYHGEGGEFDNVLIDQFSFTQTQPGSDCNGNGVPDSCDLDDCDDSPWCDDCNGNGLPDVCDAGQPGGLAYEYDDGSSEGTLGVGELAELVWIQRYMAVAGSETIVSVSTCFGTPLDPGSSGVNPGDAFRVFVWDDPDDDGNPSDAVLLSSATAYADAGSIDTDVLQEVAVDPVTVDGSFFIGAAALSEMWPAPMDGDGVLAHESWVTLGWPDEGGFDPTNIQFVDFMDGIGYPSNWLLRAASQVGPAPNDCNGNGIPDECEQCGDLDMDGDVDYDDYVLFLDAFGGVADGEPMQDWCCDYDDTGAVGMLDFVAWLECYRDYVGDPYAGAPENPNKRAIHRSGASSKVRKSGFVPAP